MTLRFTLLGRFAVTRDSVAVTLATDDRTRALAALVLERGRLVTPQTLAAALWPDRHPLDPDAATRPVVEDLAVRFRSTVRPRFDLRREGDGWLLDLPDSCTDLDDLGVLQRSAEERLAAGEGQAAEDDLRAAVRLPTGRVLDGLPGPWFAARRAAVEHRLDALVDRLAGLLARTPSRSAASRLRDLTVRYPARPDAWRHRIEVVRAVAGDEAAAACFREAARALGRRLEDAAAADLRDLGDRLLPDVPARVVRVVPPRCSDGTEGGLLSGLDALVSVAAARARPVLTAGLAPAVLAVLGLPAQPPQPVRFGVLHGPEIVLSGRRLPFVLPRTRALLGVLLLSGGGPVLTEELYGRSGLGLRGDDPAPAQHAFAHLVLRSKPLESLERLDILHTSRGWLLPQVAGRLDLDLARAVDRAGRDALARGRTHVAAVALRHVLARVPAHPLAASTGDWFAARRAEILSWRGEVATVCARAEQARAAAEAVAEETGRAVRDDPLREDRWADHLLALTRAGRAPEALRRYAEAEALLERLLRTSPGPALRMLRARIEADDPSLYR